MKTENLNQPPQHTPGPWDVEPKGSKHFVDGADGLTVAYLDKAGVRDRQEIEANARLIASAPTMHTECRTVSAMLRDLAVNNSAIEIQLHALAERLYNVTLT